MFSKCFLCLFFNSLFFVLSLFSKVEKVLKSLINSESVTSNLPKTPRGVFSL